MAVVLGALALWDIFDHVDDQIVPPLQVMSAKNMNGPIPVGTTLNVELTVDVVRTCPLVIQSYAQTADGTTTDLPTLSDVMFQQGQGSYTLRYDTNRLTPGDYTLFSTIFANCPSKTFVVKQDTASFRLLPITAYAPSDIEVP